MKKKSIIYLLLFSFTFSFSFTSCEDMLDVQSDRHSYKTAQDTLYAYWGVLKSLQNVGERHVLLGELRGDLVMANIYDGEVSDSLAAIANFTSTTDGDCRYLQARDYYAIINNCNAYIAAADTNRIVYGGTTNNSKYMLREYAQVEAIRAWTYLQLVQLYKEVPFYLEPLTSTDAIDNFISDSNHQMADAASLPKLLEPRLLPLINKVNLDELPNPSYGEYKLMAHSSFCMFPLQLVLGDIYLNANEYEKAAQQYYWWMRKDMYTAVPRTGKNHATVRPTVHDGVRTFNYGVSEYDCFSLTSSHARGNDDEAITVIPGTTNKLWGNVLRGVNEAFGFTSEVRVNTTGASADSAVTSSSVTLTPKTFRRQFIASNEFRGITKRYPAIEIDENETKNINISGQYAYRYITQTGVDADTARDGRYGWLRTFFAETAGGQYCADSLFIHKQNPHGAFSTTYPVVYRRALVWLRYAEAINRAGHPEYAYAVLRDGLYKGIVPTANECDVCLFDKDSLICRRTVTETTVELGEDAEEGAEPEIITTVTLELLPNGSTEENVELNENQTLVKRGVTLEMSPEEYDKFFALAADEQFMLCDSISANIELVRSYLSKFMPKTLNRNQNSDKNYMATAEYIPSHEILAASQMHAVASDKLANLATQTSEYLDFTSNNFTTTNSVDIRCLGIHQRGNGYSIITSCPDTLYTFDKCVKSKWPKYEGQLNKYMVDGAEYDEYKENIINAVEELIIDELALECCFEGNRYNDLVRFSKRANRGTDWLTEKVNRRGAGVPRYVPVTITPDNMYLKLPNR